MDGDSAWDALEQMLQDLERAVHARDVRAARDGIASVRAVAKALPKPARKSSYRPNGRKKGTVPYGLQRTGPDMQLVPNSEERANLATMRALRAKGHSYQEIADICRGRGIRTRRGRPYSRGHIHHMLKEAQ